MPDTLLHHWFEEVWNKKNAAVIREMLTEDTIHHGLSGPAGEPIKGFEAFEQFHSMMLEGIPDTHVEIEDYVINDDKIATRFTVTGTNTGPLQGMPATGKKVRFTGGGIAKVKDGKFVEIWNMVDFPKMQYDLAADTPDVE